MLIELNGHEKSSGIYRIVNLVNGRIYIGSSVKFSSRASEHLSSLRKQKHGNSFLQHDFDKCGEQNFKFETVELVMDKKDLVVREQYYLDLYYDKRVNCYNICPIATSQLGVKRSAETRAKMSAYRTGKRLSEETKAKMSSSMKGHKASPEALTKARARRHTAETKVKISASNKGKSYSPEALINMSNGQRGRKHPQEIKQKMSADRTNNPSHVFEWKFLSPSGELVCFINLNKFCREHPELKLQRRYLRAVRDGKRNEYKGWTRYIETVETKKENI